MNWRAVVTLVKQNGDVDVQVCRFPAEDIVVEMRRLWLENVENHVRSVAHKEFLIERVEEDVPE